MRIGQLAQTLAKLYLNPQTRKRAVLIRGASGIGKTESVAQLSEALAPHIPNWQPEIDIRLSQFDIVDFRGIPFIHEERTHWAPPAFFPKEGTAGIIMLDEIDHAPPSLQSVAYQLTNERRVGEAALDDGWMVLLACNRTEDRGVHFNIAAPLLNRVTLLDVATTFDDWLMYASARGKRPEIMSCVKSRVDLLHKFDPKAPSGTQFPTPRSWFAASDILELDYEPAQRAELLNGVLGMEAGNYLETHMRVYERLPDMDRIQKDPTGTPVPDELDVLYCLAMGISARLTVDNFEPFWKYMKRMSRELQVLIVRLAYRRDKGITSCTAFGEWAQANPDAFKRS